jgi:LysM repeat protein
MHKILLSTIAVMALAMLASANVITAAAAAPTYHVVQASQTLYSIAAAYGTSTWSLARTNGIWNPDLIYVGQVLLVPSAGSAQYNPTNAAYYRFNTAPNRTYGCAYRVQYGDTLSSIAARYATDAWSIARANGMGNLNWIYAGQVVQIPGCNFAANMH